MKDVKVKFPGPCTAVVQSVPGAGMRYTYLSYRSIVYSDEKQMRDAITHRFPKATIDGGGVLRDGK